MTGSRAVWLTLVLAACGKDAPAPEEETEAPPVRVRCEPVQADTIADAVVLRGAIAPPPLAEAVVASTVPGRISKLLVAEGDLVVANQLVAQVEDPTLGAAAAETDADVEAAQVEVDAARTERTRTEALVGQGIVAQQELDTAKAREAAARAVLRGAQARSKLARRQLGRTDLRAPRAGTVLRVFKRTGELLDGADMSIAEIADLAVLELRAQVTGAELIGLVPGTAATITLDAVAGAVIPGEIVAVSPAMDAETALGTVRVRLALPDGLRPAIGLTGAAVVHRASRSALRIPTSAARRAIDGTDEALVCAGDHVEVRALALGAREPDAVEVVSGLKAGERIVVDHVLGVEDGAAIEEEAAK